VLPQAQLEQDAMALVEYLVQNRAPIRPDHTPHPSLPLDWADEEDLFAIRDYLISTVASQPEEVQTEQFQYLLKAGNLRVARKLLEE